MLGDDPLYDDSADPKGFLWDAGLEKVQATPFEVSSLHQSFHDDATSMRGGSVIHEDEIRPVLLMKRHNDWSNNVIQVELACYSGIHKVNAVLY